MVDGKTLSLMMISGANNLYNHRDEVNELNVFPVPDGDTGTNMSLTAGALADELSLNTTDNVSEAADKMAFAALRGARGNSGVILSQIFRGMSKSLKGMPECTPEQLADAFYAGAENAYKAVMKPTEGTILTVARVSAEGAVSAAKDGADLVGILENGAKEGKSALDNTPNLLPALKEAGVVDAGGRGWLYVFEGALEYVKSGEVVKTSEETPRPARKLNVAAQVSEKKDIKFQYCTEFIIKRFSSDSDVDLFRSKLSPRGDCMLVIDDDDIIKVHIHTNHPGYVLERAVELGELMDVKIDNMKLQHNSILENKEEESKKAENENVDEYGFIAVSSGKGLTSILTDLGVTRVIEGGQTMNPSTNDFLKAISKVRAKNIFIFPNNKNIIMAAQQAKELSDKNIIVIGAVTIPQCITAMMSFNPKKSAEANEKTMSSSLRKVKSAQVTFAVRDTEYEGHEIKKGDILGMIEGKIVAVGKSPEGIAEKLIERMTDDDSEFISVYYGKSAKKQAAEAMAEKLEDLYDDCDVTLKKGAQPLYYYIISVE